MRDDLNHAQLGQLLRGTKVHVHHAVPKYVQKLLGIPVNQYDEVPAMLLHKADHTQRGISFHSILYKHIPQEHWDRFAEEFPAGLTKDNAKAALKAAYQEWATSDGKTIAATDIDAIAEICDKWIDANATID